MANEHEQLAWRTSTALEAIAAHRLEFHRRSGGLERAQEVMEGRFRFLHIERQLPSPINWNPTSCSDLPHLWRFHLQYHEFLLDLALLARECDDATIVQRAWQIAVDWIRYYEPIGASVSDDAWHPYCISKRLQAWILLMSVFPPDATVKHTVMRSLHAQAELLANKLEWDLCGNHLLENLRALALAAAFFDTPAARRWLHAVVRHLPIQLEEQILISGEHFEHSTGYHALMLDLLLDMRDSLASSDPVLSQRCDRVASRVARFMRALRRPDGHLPQFGDSSQIPSGAVELLLDRALPSALDADETPTISSQAVGDYWLFRDRGDMLIFDAGPVAADWLPAHAHADLLNLEISVHGQPLIVDSGVYDYEASAMRQYCRSTAAHNTLEVDGLDQCDMWSRFRMGYRGHPSRLETGSAEEFHWARATHNAYRRRGVPQVGRWIACRAGGPWFVVDWLDGRGRHGLTSRLHLHPDVVLKSMTVTHVTVQLGRETLIIAALNSGQLSLETGWYCPELGVRQESTVVTWRASLSLPAACGWQLCWGETPNPVELRMQPDGKTWLCWRDAGRERIMEVIRRE